MMIIISPGSFLVMRIHKTGKDSRFDHVKTDPKMFFVYWTIQGLWIFLTAMPLWLLNDNETDTDAGWYLTLFHSAHVEA